jgi:hypothetical protein
VNAVTSDFGLHLEDGWSEYQVQIIIKIIDKVCNALEQKESISAQQMAGWNILDNKGVFPRGALLFPTGPVVELSRAIQALLNGTLQAAAPKGHRWLYGSEAGRNTIRENAG